MVREDPMALLGDVSRRDLLKRAALVGGTLVWAVPVIESLNMPAYAASVPPTMI